MITLSKLKKIKIKTCGFISALCLLIIVAFQQISILTIIVGTTSLVLSIIMFAIIADNYDEEDKNNIETIFFAIIYLGVGIILTAIGWLLQ